MRYYNPQQYNSYPKNTIEKITEKISRINTPKNNWIDYIKCKYQSVIIFNKNLYLTTFLWWYCCFFKNHCIFRLCHHSSEVARWAPMSIFIFAPSLVIIIYLIKNQGTYQTVQDGASVTRTPARAYRDAYKFFLCKACTCTVQSST